MGIIVAFLALEGEVGGASVAKEDRWLGRAGGAFGETVYWG